MFSRPQPDCGSKPGRPDVARAAPDQLEDLGDVELRPHRPDPGRRCGHDRRGEARPVEPRRIAARVVRERNGADDVHARRGEVDPRSLAREAGTASVWSVAATVRTCGYAPGKFGWPVAPSLPADATTRQPLWNASSTAASSCGFGWVLPKLRLITPGNAAPPSRSRDRGESWRRSPSGSHPRSAAPPAGRRRGCRPRSPAPRRPRRPRCRATRSARSTVWSLRNVVFGRPANSGCVGSTPLSMIVSGMPGPGGADWSAPMSCSHHSWLWSGSSARRPEAATAVPEAQSAATRTMSRWRRTDVREGSGTLAACSARTSAWARTSATASRRSAARSPRSPSTRGRGRRRLEPDRHRAGRLHRPAALPERRRRPRDRALRARAARAAARGRAPLRPVPRGRSAPGAADARPRPARLRRRPRSRSRACGSRTRACTSAAFVLEPLAEVAPGLEVPGQGRVEALLARLH